MVLETELCHSSGAKLYPGFPCCQVKMQVILPQPSEAHQAYLDGNVQTFMLKLLRKGGVRQRNLIQGPFLVLLWKSFRRGEWRRLKFLMLDAAWDAALREIKERIKKTKDEKKAKKAELIAKTWKTTQTKGSAPNSPKGPKLGGVGGKR